MKITVDPNTDVSGFGYAAAGQHRLRVVEVEHKEGTKAPYLAWKCEFADPNIESEDKNPDGSNKKVGNVFENTTLSTANNGQFRLRQMVEAMGGTWGDFEPEAFIGTEFEAQIGLDEYQGTIKNVIKKFVPAG